MVRETVSKVKKGMAAGPLGVAAEMLKGAGETGIEMITDLTNQIVRGVIPENWDLSAIVDCYKGKGEALDRDNYRSLVDQVLKVVERLVEKQTKSQINIDDRNAVWFSAWPRNQWCYCIQREMQEKYPYCAFVVFGKAFDRVPRDIVWWALHKLGVSKWLVMVAQAMYSDDLFTCEGNVLFSCVRI